MPIINLPKGGRLDQLVDKDDLTKDLDQRQIQTNYQEDRLKDILDQLKITNMLLAEAFDLDTRDYQ